MRKLRDASEDDMIAIFLKGEIGSKRFGKRIESILEKDNKPRSIIDVPDLSDKEENTYRLTLLRQARGYRQNEDIFENFPEDVVWQFISLTKEELEKVKYTEYDYWNELSGGTRLPKDAAKRIEQGIEVFEQSNKQFQQAAEALKAGNTFPTLILVTADNKNLIALEGHLRLTAYFLAPDYIPSEIEVLLGVARDLSKWDSLTESH